jgi:mono/diheme cytochrome c family protein
LKLQPWHRLVLTVCAVVSIAVFYRGHQVAEGQKVFERLGCQTCHMAGGAPSLAQVGRKYDRATFVEWLADPDTIYTRLGRKPLNSGYPAMPRQQASHHDIEMISYFLAAQR